MKKTKGLIPKTVNTKTFLATILTLTIVVAFTLNYALSAGTVTIVPASFVETASYTIWKDGSTYYAKNGLTGAVDSGTDASTIIIDSITADSSIFLKAGTYTISATITKAVHNVVIEGDGNATIIKVADSTNINAFNLTSVYGWTLRNFAIDGNKANQADQNSFALQCGIFMGTEQTPANDYAKGITLENLYIYDTMSLAISGRNLVDITVLNCHIRNTGQGGISLKSVKNTVVTGNLLNNVGTYSQYGERKDHAIYNYGENMVISNNVINGSASDGISVYSSGAPTDNNVTISDNVITYVGRIGIYVTRTSPYSSGCIVSNNIIAYSGQNASETWKEGIKSAGRFNIISNNYVIGAPTIGIYVAGAGFNTVSGNLVTNGTGSIGIKIRLADYSTVTGNVVSWVTTGIGINVDNTNYSTITGNVAYGNLYGFNLDTAYYNVFTGNLAEGNGNYGFVEWANIDYNSFVSCSAFNNPSGNIILNGANSECHSCFNGTTWVT